MHVYTTFSLSIYLRMDIRLFPWFFYCGLQVYEKLLNIHYKGMQINQRSTHTSQCGYHQKKKKKKVNIGKDAEKLEDLHTVGASSKLVLAICLGKD